MANGTPTIPLDHMAQMRNAASTRALERAHGATQGDAANPPYEEPIPMDTTAGLSEEDQTLQERLHQRQQERWAQEAADIAAWERGDVWDEERQRWRAGMHGGGQQGRDRAVQARAPFPWERSPEEPPTREPAVDVPPPGVGPSRIRREAKD